MNGSDDLEPERLFLAVFPPEAVQLEAARTAQALRATARGVAWVKPEQLHFTLRFLGHRRPPERVLAIEAANAAAAPLTGFDASLGGYGAFPNAARARVIWLGLNLGCAQLRELAAALDDALAARGLGRAEQPFAAHLTLGRVRQPSDWTSALATAPPPADVRFRVESVTLVRSTLGAGGSRYERLHEARLGG